jgi:sugar/nucleoside kinase (ribokinase family)
MTERPYDILAIGDVNIDLILGIRDLPAFGQEVLAHGLSQHLGGCTANFACYCARLGLRTALLARVGRDGYGEFLLAELERLGVCTTQVITDPKLPTGITVSLSGPNDRAFVTYLGTIDSLTGADAPDTLLAAARWVHLGSYFLQSKLQPEVPDLLARARAQGALTSLDTGYDPAEQWDGAIGAALAQTTVFLPNEVEATGITGEADPGAALAALRGLGPAVAIKLGAAGARYEGNAQGASLGAYQVQVVDTTCCGDAFDAGFIAAWLCGKEPAERLAWGNACGALVASAPGNAAEKVSVAAVQRVVATGRV